MDHARHYNGMLLIVPAHPLHTRPLQGGEATKMEEGEFFAIETFGSTGGGKREHCVPPRLGLSWLASLPGVQLGACVVRCLQHVGALALQPRHASA